MTVYHKVELFSQSPLDSDVLSRVQVFRGVDMRSIEHLLANCELVDIVKDDIILSPDNRNENLYIVVSGRLSVYLSIDTKQDILATIDKGECAGEISIIDSKMPSAIVQATEDSRLLIIHKETLWQMISVSHEISRNLLYILSENVRFSNRLIADSLELQNKCQLYATIDTVTGIHNRGWLEEMFQRELERSARDELKLSLIMFDIDNFKDYNDRYGHIAGDKVLRMIGNTIHYPLRPNDMVARYGGEEFAVMLPETTAQQALDIADRIRDYIADQKPDDFNGEPLPSITISLGVAESTVGMDLESLMHEADSAMYRAKQKGKNCVSL